MKSENMYSGLRVVVKKCATGYASTKVGVVGTLRRVSWSNDCWTLETTDDSFGVLPNEVRKARDGE